MHVYIRVYMYPYTSGANARRVHMYLHASGAKARRVYFQKHADHAEQQECRVSPPPPFTGVLASFEQTIGHNVGLLEKLERQPPGVSEQKRTGQD